MPSDVPPVTMQAEIGCLAPGPPPFGGGAYREGVGKWVQCEASEVLRTLAMVNVDSGKPREYGAGLSARSAPIDLAKALSAMARLRPARRCAVGRARHRHHHANEPTKLTLDGRATPREA